MSSDKFIHSEGWMGTLSVLKDRRRKLRNILEHYIPRLYIYMDYLPELFDMDTNVGVQNYNRIIEALLKENESDLKDFINENEDGFQMALVTRIRKRRTNDIGLSSTDCRD